MSQDQTHWEEEGAPETAALERLKRRAGIEAAFLWAFFNKWLLRGLFIALHVMVILGGFYGVVWWGSSDACYSSVDRVPARLVGLVLGCVKKAGPYDNEFFKNRVDAAAKLYQAGKVQFLLVSGDNSHHGYDEPSDLKAALIEKGVPARRIYCDYAGFRTFDSVVRAKKIFGQDDCTIVSQRFHNERALYIARRTGMPDAVAFNADDVAGEWMMKAWLREVFARLKAVLDVEFLRTEPKFLGQRVAIGPRDPPVDAPAVPGAKKE